VTTARSRNKPTGKNGLGDTDYAKQAPIAQLLLLHHAPQESSTDRCVSVAVWQASAASSRLQDTQDERPVQ